MPTIRKLAKKVSAKRNFRQKYYQMSAWKNLRNLYIQQHPICEDCNKTIAAHVHHILSPFEMGLSENERLARLLCVDNLRSVCVDCHNLEHMKKTTFN